MTGKTFRLQVIGVIIFVVLAWTVAIWASYKWSEYGEGLRAGPAVFIPIGAAWLAYCWQRRVAFTKALFDVWQKIVVAVQDAIQYTHLPQRSQTDFAKVMHGLSCRIDDIRGAFRNVDEGHIEMSEDAKRFVLAIKHSKTLAQIANEVKRQPARDHIGIYPFESLKQIQKVVDTLGFGQNATPDQALIARQAILALWQVLRSELLKELDRDFPEYTDTPFKA
jgi:hypothetical protein